MEYTLPFKEYNKALKKNRLLGLKCRDCGEITCPPKISCQSCRSLNQEITQLSGQGTVVSFTTCFIAPEGRENEVPYTIVLVELAEGPWIMGNLIAVNHDQISMDIIGQKVMMTTRTYPGDRYSAGASSRPAFIPVN